MHVVCLQEALLIERDDKEGFLSKAKDMRDDLEQALADLEQVLEQKKAEAQDIDQQLARAEGRSGVNIIFHCSYDSV